MWRGKDRLPIRNPIFTYLGHTIAGTGYNGKPWDAVFASVQVQTVAYYELPLTSFECARIVSCVLLPRWTYTILFLWDVCWSNRLKATFDVYVRAAPRVEKYL